MYMYIVHLLNRNVTSPTLLKCVFFLAKDYDIKHDFVLKALKKEDISIKLIIFIYYCPLLRAICYDRVIAARGSAGQLVSSRSSIMNSVTSRKIQCILKIFFT